MHPLIRVLVRLSLDENLEISLTRIQVTKFWQEILEQDFQDFSLRKIRYQGADHANLTFI